MSTISYNTHHVAQALNQMSKIKQSQTTYAELMYIVKFAMMNNITNVHLDVKDLMFLNGYLGKE